MAFDDQTTIAAFSARVGVTRQAVERGLRRGRIAAYDAAGNPLPPTAKGRKFLKMNEALAAWHLSRARIDDSTLTELDGELDLAAPAPTDRGGASKSLTQAKTEKETLQIEFLKQRMARERGELISRRAALDALEAAGAAVRAKLASVVFWAEEIEGALHTGGAAEVARVLKQRVGGLQKEIADGLASALADGEESAGDAPEGSEADLV